MDLALLISTSLIQNDNAPPAAIITDNVVSIGRHGTIKMDTMKTHEVSKHHAEIRLEDFRGKNYYFIEDKKSMNGTFLNSKKIKKHVLKDGDEIVFGAGSCFYYGDQITSTDSAECRYIFVLPDPKIEYSPNSNRYINLTEINNNEECCICYIPMGMKSTLTCGHSFCRKCLASWGKKCKTKEMSFVCPICRHEFDPSQAIIPSVRLENNVNIIYDVEPFLRILEISSLKEIERLSIFNPWTSEDRVLFWNFLNKIADKNKKQIIFRKATNTSYRDIISATTEQLNIAKGNLNIELKNPDYLLFEVLKKISIQIYHRDSSKPNTTATTTHRVRNY